MRKQLKAILGYEFALQADEDRSVLHPVVADNIDFIRPGEGKVVYRLLQLAKERNISYDPSYGCQMALNDYLEREYLLDPRSDGRQQQ